MYQIILEGKQLRKNQVTGMHLMAAFLLIVMGFLTWLVPNDVKQEEFAFLNWVGLGYSFFGLAILVICIFFNKKIIQSKANLALRLLEVLSLAPILIYSLVQEWYLPAGYSAAALLGIVLAFYWEKSGKQSRKAIFDESGVQIPRLGRDSELDWDEVSRVLLKHNILTIDCYNNKLFQFSVEANSQTVDKEIFNRFCLNQIKLKSNSNKKDW